jgi:hypothetical protein
VEGILTPPWLVDPGDAGFDQASVADDDDDSTNWKGAVPRPGIITHEYQIVGGCTTSRAVINIRRQHPISEITFLPTICESGRADKR